MKIQYNLIFIFISDDHRNQNNAVIGNHVPGGARPSGNNANNHNILTNKTSESSPLLPKETIITIDYVSKKFEFIS